MFAGVGRGKTRSPVLGVVCAPRLSGVPRPDLSGFRQVRAAKGRMGGLPL